ncbi:SDR family NAD(P)-dependent oxidoreductase [Curtobacterium pusillum]|uniref:SDR family NAD(P)-dependent oxidoreductase n=1 Tax=Curtobacterium pusillum TaxID=69373 RepID=UPI001C930BF6|nr:SDR family NAD(P)-dependent oxidoreductase [Curtobacterium pusillum]
MSTERVVLITGGTSGIGRGLAERYVATGATVVVSGRDQRRLDATVAVLPGAVGIAGDLSTPTDRERLADAVRERFGRLDVLVLNAGIQRRVAWAEDHAPWSERQQEIDLLLSAPVHLTALLGDLVRAAPAGQIVVVTSGGAVVPQPFAPVYSAAKAAVRSWTTTLRAAHRGTVTQVTELLPPAVATGLAGPGAAHGADLDAFCDAVFPRLEAREDEVGYGLTDSLAFRAVLDAARERFTAAEGRFPVRGFAD